MTIVKWTPFTELDSMERRMRRLFEEIGFAPGLAPAADVYETDEEFVVELEVPGYEEKELSIEVSDHTLAIKGSRREDARRRRRRSSPSTSGSSASSSAASSSRARSTPST